MSLDQHFAQLFAAVADEPEDRLENPTLEQLRANYREQRKAVDQPGPASVTARDISVSSRGGVLRARLYTPAEVSTPGPGLVYFHGGGFVLGDLDSHDGHCRRLAAGSGVRLLAIDYRLAPEHPFPAAHDDAVDAVRWAFDHADELGMDARRIAVGGDSAGGNLAASVALELKDDPIHRPAFQLLLYPPTWPEEETASRRDMDGPILTKATMAWFQQLSAIEGHPLDGRARIGRRRDLSNAPPALIVTAGHDPLKDEGRDYGQKLRQAGVACAHVEYGPLVHDFFVMSGVSPAVGQALDETAAALKAAIA